MKTLLIGLAVAGAGPQTQVPPPAEPLTAEIETGDADRFAALWKASGGKPDAAQLQAGYLDGGSYGVHVFTPNRIRSAEHLAKAVAAKPADYQRAIDECLPVAKATMPELRATYLALSGLFPDKPLPRIYLVMGAGNSGGTAGEGAQVLGLEVLCKISPTPAALRDLLRKFYAHETVHALQTQGSSEGGPLLASILAEGAADFVAALVTGQQPDPERAEWASAREADLWAALEADLKLTRDADYAALKDGAPETTAMYRWVANYGNPPEGWPSELGYWMGQRIWQRWYDRQPDKKAAIREMLSPGKPLEVLAEGRFVAGGA